MRTFLLSLLVALAWTGCQVPPSSLAWCTRTCRVPFEPWTCWGPSTSVLQAPTAGSDKPWTAEPLGTWRNGWRPTAPTPRSGLRASPPTIGMPWGLPHPHGSPGVQRPPWCQNGPTTTSTARCFWTPWSGWTANERWCLATPPKAVLHCWPPKTQANIGIACHATRFPPRWKVKRHLPRPTATWHATATPCGSSQGGSPLAACDRWMLAHLGPHRFARHAGVKHDRRVLCDLSKRPPRLGDGRQLGSSRGQRRQPRRHCGWRHDVGIACQTDKAQGTDRASCITPPKQEPWWPPDSRAWT